jgi:spore coat protein U-like protein
MYSDSGRTTVFPTATGTLSGTGIGSAQSILIYGQIASGITLPTPQAYTDTITFTVSY